LSFCKNCGAELKESASFCSNCGISTAPGARIEREQRVPRYEREREACFGPPGSGGGLWGAISGAIFLIGLGILWYFDFWWPGILFLIAIMAIIGGLVAYSRR
jgi:hypothetical protein